MGKNHPDFKNIGLTLLIQTAANQKKIEKIEVEEFLSRLNKRHRIKSLPTES